MRHSRIADRDLALIDVLRGSGGDDGDPVTLRTPRGDIPGRYHPTADGWTAERGVVWIGGAGGGLDGPAHLYPTMARLLREHQIESLRLDYRWPNHLEDCVRDTLIGVSWLGRERDLRRIAVIGHSFGGAVAINAGVTSPEVHAVATLASQTAHAEAVSRLAPKPLLVLHGEADTVLPASCARWLERRAGQPKQVRLYPGCGHGLEQCREQVIRDLRDWLVETL